MSVDAENKSQPGRWIIYVVIALLVYVVSIGPLGALAWKYRVENPWLAKSAFAFYGPILWMAACLPSDAGKLLVGYFMWWCELYHAPFMIG